MTTTTVNPRVQSLPRPSGRAAQQVAKLSPHAARNEGRLHGKATNTDATTAQTTATTAAETSVSEPGGAAAVAASVIPTESNKTTAVKVPLSKVSAAALAAASVRNQRGVQLQEPLTLNAVPAPGCIYDNDEHDYICYKHEVFPRVELKKQYVALRRRGRGAYGQVIECLEQTLDGQAIRLVAVKIVKNQAAYLNQAVMEVRSLLRLARDFPQSEHLHVTNIFDHFIYRNHLFIVLYLLGQNLFEVSQQRSFCSLPAMSIQHIAMQLFETLVLLQSSRIIHCDLKPENIMIGFRSPSSQKFCTPPPYKDAMFLNLQQLTRTGKHAITTAVPIPTKSALTTPGQYAGGNSINNYGNNTSNGTCKPFSHSSATATDTTSIESTATAATSYTSTAGPPAATAGSSPGILSPSATQAASILSPQLPLCSKESASVATESLAYLKSLLDNFLPITLIDFGSSCFESEAFMGYIQSRYYRAPEVLLGLPHWYAIDVWSVGCILAELFLGVPLFAGEDEFDQLHRIVEAVGPPPDILLDRAQRTPLFFTRVSSESESAATSTPAIAGGACTSSKWRLRPARTPSSAQLTRLRLTSLDELVDLVTYRESMTPLEQFAETQWRLCFVDFLKKTLDPNPFSRITPWEATKHPFVAKGFEIEFAGKTTRQLSSLCCGRSSLELPGQKQRLEANMGNKLHEYAVSILHRLTPTVIETAVQNRLKSLRKAASQSGLGEWERPPIEKILLRRLLSQKPLHGPSSEKNTFPLDDSAGSPSVETQTPRTPTAAAVAAGVPCHLNSSLACSVVAASTLTSLLCTAAKNRRLLPCASLRQQKQRQQHDVLARPRIQDGVASLVALRCPSRSLSVCLAELVVDDGGSSSVPSSATPVSSFSGSHDDRQQHCLCEAAVSTSIFGTAKARPTTIAANRGNTDLSHYHQRPQRQRQEQHQQRHWRRLTQGSNADDLSSLIFEQLASPSNNGLLPPTQLKTGCPLSVTAIVEGVSPAVERTVNEFLSTSWVELGRQEGGEQPPPSVLHTLQSQHGALTLQNGLAPPNCTGNHIDSRRFYDKQALATSTVTAWQQPFPSSSPASQNKQKHQDSSPPRNTLVQQHSAPDSAFSTLEQVTAAVSPSRSLVHFVCSSNNPAPSHTWNPTVRRQKSQLPPVLEEPVKMSVTLPRASSEDGKYHSPYCIAHSSSYPVGTEVLPTAFENSLQHLEHYLNLDFCTDDKAYRGAPSHQFPAGHAQALQLLLPTPLSSTETGTHPASQPAPPPPSPPAVAHHHPLRRCGSICLAETFRDSNRRLGLHHHSTVYWQHLKGQKAARGDTTIMNSCMGSKIDSDDSYRLIMEEAKIPNFGYEHSNDGSRTTRDLLTPVSSASNVCNELPSQQFSTSCSAITWTPVGSQIYPLLGTLQQQEQRDAVPESWL